MALLETAAVLVPNKIVWLAALQKQGPPRCGKAADKLQGVARHSDLPLRIVEFWAVPHPAGMQSHEWPCRKSFLPAVWRHQAQKAMNMLT